MIAEIVNPDYRFSSIIKITPEWLRVHKYRVILMDIDNTLVARNSWAVPEKHIDWLKQMQDQDIMIVLASNNGGKRIAAIEKQLTDHGLHIPLLRWAGKPFPRAYAGAIRLLEESAAKEGKGPGLYSGSRGSVVHGCAGGSLVQFAGCLAASALPQ